MAYTIKRGDTLGAIARANGTTVAKLVELNPFITNPDVIRIGWELTLPGEADTGGGGDAAPPAATGGQSLNNVPGTPEVWLRADGFVFLVYQVPGTEADPVYMAWHVPTPDDLQSMFGPDQPIVYNRENISGAQWAQMGILEFGTTDELPATEKDPFASWASEVETQAISQPWILDDDYQALMAMAILEGRPVTQAEIKTTNWWRTHSAGERAWMIAYHGDPETAADMVADAELEVAEKLTAAGAGAEPPAEVVSLMARKWVQGNWTDSYLNSQVRAITDPASPYEIDAELLPLVSEGAVTQTISEEDRVRELLNTWLGPNFGGWDDAAVAEVAGKIRNDPEHEARFIEQLKDQRLALLPEYGDRELSYQAIANTWKQWWVGQWGETPDESSDLWMRVLRNNDMAESAMLLRGEGLKQGKKKVIDDFGAQTITALGSSVRRGVYV